MNIPTGPLQSFLKKSDQKIKLRFLMKLFQKKVNAAQKVYKFLGEENQKETLQKFCNFFDETFLKKFL